MSLKVNSRGLGFASLLSSPASSNSAASLSIAAGFLHRKYSVHAMVWPGHVQQTYVSNPAVCMATYGQNKDMMLAYATGTEAAARAMHEPDTQEISCASSRSPLQPAR